MSGIRLAAETAPVDVAWAAFDTAAIELHGMFAAAGHEPDVATAAGRERADKAVEVVRLWDAWRSLFLADDKPRPAA